VVAKGQKAKIIIIITHALQCCHSYKITLLVFGSISITYHPSFDPPTSDIGLPNNARTLIRGSEPTMLGYTSPS
jgi:hypothetical protein